MISLQWPPGMSTCGACHHAYDQAAHSPSRKRMSSNVKAKPTDLLQNTQRQVQHDPPVGEMQHPNQRCAGSSNLIRIAVTQLPRYSCSDADRLLDHAANSHADGSIETT